ncbi:MAG TPA: class I SAM-dependent methyltransferase [Gemmatimonadales bacterium]|jgi:2-polyprenyl-3-methyl-5-hydroxy-6-metoxy-1,4-benzoquinol methylase
MRPSERDEMLATNVHQREYYENATGSDESCVNSGATNLWRRMRARVFSVLASDAAKERLRHLHLGWLGPLSNLRILDLGVGDGNLLSFDLARGAGEYVAVDLSSARLARFNQKLTASGIPGARLLSADFLDPKSDLGRFDVIYAMAVLHHFRHVQALVDALENRLVPGGRIISYDPLQTWLPMRLVRAAYRPLQTDRAWEFPFSRHTLAVLTRQFHLLNIQGFYGRSKWALPLAMVSHTGAEEAARRWHDYDLKQARSVDAVGHCLHVSLHLRRRGPEDGA